MFEEHHSQLATRRALSLAIQAVEKEREQRIGSASRIVRRRKKAFYEVLDAYSLEIFSSIAKVAALGGRRVFLPSISGISDEIDSIFDRGLGMCDPHILNDWLHDRDLAHMFSGTEFAITW